MSRAALLLSLAAVALVAACASAQGERTARVNVPVQTQQMPYQAGYGVVQWVAPAPAAASAGGTAPAAAPSGPVHRLGVRMEDGRMQYVDVTGDEIPQAGTRVQLTPDHLLLKR